MMFWVSDGMPPEEGLDGGIAYLEVKELEYVALHGEKLLLGVGIVGDVAEVLHMWRADLLVLPATTPKAQPKSIHKIFISPSKGLEQEVALTKQ